MKNKYDFSDIGKICKERIDKGILPGVNIAVSIKGERVYEYNDGYSDIEKKIKLSNDAIFRLASMTKPITAVAVLLLQDRGLLNVKDKVSKYIPQFRHMLVGALSTENKLVKAYDSFREITIEDILTHSSGLGSGMVGNIQYNSFSQNLNQNLAERVDVYSHMLLDFSPGTSQLYSAVIALDVVARIVEIISKTDYESFLINNIFQPLEMSDTSYSLSEKQRKRLVKLYRLSDDVKYLEPKDIGMRGHECIPENYTAGTAGLFSTLDDYVNFANMLCADGIYKGRRILSESSVKSMRTPYFKNGFAGINEYFNWGYAVRVVSAVKDGVQMLPPGSFGWSGAYNTHFWVDTVNSLTGVYMSNMDNAGGAGAVTAFEFECNTIKTLRSAEKNGL